MISGSDIGSLELKANPISAVESKLERLCVELELLTAINSFSIPPPLIFFILVVQNPYEISHIMAHIHLY